MDLPQKGFLFSKNTYCWKTDKQNEWNNFVIQVTRMDVYGFRMSSLFPSKSGGAVLPFALISVQTTQYILKILDNNCYNSI